MTDKKEDNTQELVSVEFKKAWGRYVKGDIAGFDKKQAAALKSAKVAVEPKK